MPHGHQEPLNEETATYPASGKARKVAGIGYLNAWGASAPSDSTTGYATGCLFQNTGGGTDTSLYVNEGDEDSSTWVVVTTT